MTMARHPALKTRTLEHAWLDDPPGDCHPIFEDPYYDFGPCAGAWLFNHGHDATPITLFFDGSVDMLRTGDVARQDQMLIDQSGFGLWSRDTPLGSDGYFGAFGRDDPVSHHILTTDGILGRDRLAR
jgi:hypothetical protein